MSVASMFDGGPERRGLLVSGAVLVGGGLLLLCIGMPLAIYTQCRIDVPAKHMAVLTRRTGENLENGEEIAPDDQHKGLQLKVLTEGRYFYNPYVWDWEVYPMVEIPEDKMGVRVRLYGDDLPYGHFVATQENEKGIVREVLRPGRYAINAIVIDASGQSLNGRHLSDYVEIVELHDPVTIPAGFKGVLTNLAGPMPEDPNQLLVPDGYRGVQEETLEPGTYYMNPYMYRIDPIDCRSQRFNLAENRDMGFPSKDGFWVSLDGIIEFSVNPERAAEVYVTYNEVGNDEYGERSVGEEIIRKVIMPNARSFCRLRGSNSSGRDFISGETRSAFQRAFQQAIADTCGKQGIDIIQALVTKISPPQAIAGPVRDREIARQELKQYAQEQSQFEEEAKLATEKALVTQKEKLVDAQREVIRMTTEAMQRQEVALAEANRDLEVAEELLKAAKDQAEALLAEKRAEAAVIHFANEAEAAGWKRSVEALDGDGDAFARYVMYQKLAPGFRTIMANTADSPFMTVFQNFTGAASGLQPSPNTGPANLTSSQDKAEAMPTNSVTTTAGSK